MGCDVRVMDDDGAPEGEVAEEDMFCDTETVPFASAATGNSSRSSTVPEGGRSAARSTSPTPLSTSPSAFDQAILGSRGISTGAGATLFILVKCAYGKIER